MHKCIEFAVSSVVVSCLAAPNTNFEFVFERVFAREVSEREVSERLRHPIPWAGQLDNTF